MTVRDFLRWWGGQLMACLPDALARRGADRHADTILAMTSAPSAHPVTLDLIQPGRRHLPPRRRTMILTELGTEPGLGQLRDMLGPGRPPAVRLRVPPGMLLQREVVLPIAAERAPDQVLRYELDRLCPFRADEMLWGFEVTRRDRARGRLCLRLTLAPLVPLSRLLDGLRRIGVTPTVLESEEDPTVPDRGARRIVLGGTRPPRHWRGPRAAGALCAALAVAVITVPFVRQSITLGAIQAQMDALRPSVAEAETLRRRAEAAAAGGDVMQAERQRFGDPLQALAAATDALPDDTWISDLTLQQRRLTLAGQSRDAVRLIGRLSAAAALRNPSFTAPVTRSQDGGDMFSISAELAP